MRHPKPCKFFAYYGRCKFAEFCSFTHNTTYTSNVEKEIDNLKQEIKELKKQNIELKEMILKIDEKENASMEKSTEETKESETPASKDFKCDKCNYLASSKTVLKRHMTMKQTPHPKYSPKTPTVCVGQLDGCSASTSEYFPPRISYLSYL